MSGTVEVVVTKSVPRNCSTCLYRPSNGLPGCAHADRRTDWLIYSIFENCPSWWLDQTRFKRAR